MILLRTSSAATCWVWRQCAKCSDFRSLFLPVLLREIALRINRKENRSQSVALGGRCVVCASFPFHSSANPFASYNSSVFQAPSATAPKRKSRCTDSLLNSPHSRHRSGKAHSACIRSRVPSACTTATTTSATAVHGESEHEDDR